MATQTSTVKPARPLFGDVQALIDRLTLRPRGEFRAGATRLHSLSASLTRDLVRFGSAKRGEATIKLLEVTAAAVRHGHALRLILQRDVRCCELTMFPRWGVVHVPGERGAPAQRPVPAVGTARQARPPSFSQRSSACISSVSMASLRACSVTTRCGSST